MNRKRRISWRLVLRGAPPWARTRSIAARPLRQVSDSLHGMRSWTGQRRDGRARLDVLISLLFVLGLVQLAHDGINFIKGRLNVGEVVDASTSRLIRCRWRLRERWYRVVLCVACTIIGR